jgi:hypothetical protein
MQKLTVEQAAILSAFTGILCGRFSDMAQYAERIMGRPILTHEYPGIADQLKEAARDDFMSICNIGGNAK